MEPVTFDKYGRMCFHPEFHAKSNAPWTTLDQKYLIDNYELVGPEEISLSLERTIYSVITKAAHLRKAGLMKKPDKHVYHKRMRADMLTAKEA